MTEALSGRLDGDLLRERALGYRKLITYTLATEGGGSLRAAGFRIVGQVTGRSWSCQSRPRVDTHPQQDKLRWEVAA